MHSSTRLHSAKKFVTQDDILYCTIPLLGCIFIFYFLRALDVVNSDLAVKVVYYFMLDPSTPNTNVFLSSYTHIYLLHLLGNILIYVIIYVLVSRLVDDSRKLKELMVLGLVVFPVVNSVFCIWVLSATPGNGLSGIIFCLLGYLPLAMYYHTRDSMKIPFNLNTVLITVFFNLTMYSTIEKMSVAMVLGFILAVLVYVERKRLQKILPGILGMDSQRKLITEDIVLFGSFVFSLVAFGGFTPDLQAAGSNVGVEVHMFGWMYGLVVAYFVCCRNMGLLLKTEVPSKQ